MKRAVVIIGVMAWVLTVGIVVYVRGVVRTLLEAE